MVQQALKVQAEPAKQHVQVQVKIETVRSASRRASQTIKQATDQISREAGAEADKAMADE